MKDFTLKDIKLIIDYKAGRKTLLTDDLFIDERLIEYKEKYKGLHPYYSIFYHLAKQLQPDFTVELGAWEGTAAACLASYQKGLVVTIDHHGDPGDELNEEKCCEAAKEYSNLTYIKGWTWDVIDTVKSFNRPIDILFIDSWHQYEYAIKDWNLYSPLLADNALVICDDLLFEDGAVIAGMKKFWYEVKGRNETMIEGKSHIGYPMGWIKWQKT